MEIAYTQLSFIDEYKNYLKIELKKKFKTDASKNF